MQPGDVDRTCADISKAQRLLGYNPQTPFEVGIARMADWYKQVGDICAFRCLLFCFVADCYVGFQAFEQGMFDENPEPHFPVAPDPVRRHNDDLELSSNVEKAQSQVSARAERYWEKEQEVTRESMSARESMGTRDSRLSR
jgi:hypothetical protein